MDAGCKIVTGVDRLLMMINEEQEIPLSQAVKEFDISRGVVEHWADTLEGAGLIMTRTTLNDRFLLSLERDACTTGSIAAIKRNLKSLMNGTVPDIDAMRRLSDELNVKIRALETHKGGARKIQKLQEKIEKDKTKAKELQKRLALQQLGLRQKEKLLTVEKERFKSAYLKLQQERTVIEQERANILEKERQLSETLQPNPEVLPLSEPNADDLPRFVEQKPTRDETIFLARMLTRAQ